MPGRLRAHTFVVLIVAILDIQVVRPGTRLRVGESLGTRLSGGGNGRETTGAF
jgi:hypothetical protein